LPFTWRCPPLKRLATALTLIVVVVAEHREHPCSVLATPDCELLQPGENRLLVLVE
jgi:hypothetical protein